MTIMFVNKGDLDTRAITTFGVSSKERDGAIGYFGTGLKYAIAVLLREGCKVTIATGGERFDFDTVTERIRVSDFETVRMNGDRLGFTTELGKNWEMWQAYRELWSNCADEGGSIKHTTQPLPECFNPEPGYTMVIVESEKFERVHFNRFQEVLCPDRDPIDSNDFAVCLPGATNRLFYRGIRIYDGNRPYKNTYNLNVRVDLTEDRTLKYNFQAQTAIGCFLGACKDEKVIEEALLATNDFAESGIDFEIAPKGFTEETFIEVATRLCRTHPQQVNSTVRAALKIRLGDTLPQVSENTMMTSVNNKRVEKALSFLHGIGVNPDEYPIIIVHHIDKGIMGLAHEGKIYLSSLAFDGGTKTLAGTLLEEWMHLKFGVQDCTREMQNMLVDRIITVGEQINGEPL